LTTKRANEKDHLVSEALTEGSEAGTLLLLLGKMLFLTHSAKGNPLGGLYIPPVVSSSHLSILMITLIPILLEKPKGCKLSSKREFPFIKLVEEVGGEKKVIGKCESC
jgi:hypothetical protein